MIGHNASSAVETARFYTASRKFPRMIGRLPEGTRLWGGPYTFAQLGVGAGIFALALVVRPVWSTGSLVIDLLLLGGLSWGAALAARLLPASRLNPLVLITVAMACALSPASGTYRGRALRLPRPKVRRQ